MAMVMRILHIDEPGNLDAKKNMEKIYGCVDGCGDGDAACGGDYVCSCFMCCVEDKVRNIKIKSEIRNGRSFVCATMQESEISKWGRRLRWFLYLFIIVLDRWVIIMSRTNESDACVRYLGRVG